MPPESAGKLLESRREAPLEGDTETARWWRDRQDWAFRTALDVSEKELKGVSITSSTTSTLALAKSKFRQVTKVSPDGA